MEMDTQVGGAANEVWGPVTQIWPSRDKIWKFLRRARAGQPKTISGDEIHVSELLVSEHGAKLLAVPRSVGCGGNKRGRVVVIVVLAETCVGTTVVTYDRSVPVKEEREKTSDTQLGSRD